MDRQEVFDRVKKCIVEALDVDDDEVSEDAVLTDDLEAESIDFMDISFRLEKEFGIKIEQGELFPSQDILSNKEYVDGGAFTKAGLEVLRGKYPFLKAEGEGLRLSDLQKLYTVGMLVDFVIHKTSR